MYDIASSLSLLSFGFIVNKKKFLELLRLSENSAFTPTNIKMAFRITGISPFNPAIAIEKANIRPGAISTKYDALILLKPAFTDYCPICRQTSVHIVALQPF